MNEHEKKCPCEAVEHLTELVAQHSDRLEKHEKRLGDGNTNFAVINTKLNFMLGVLSTIGIAIVGVLVKYILHLG